MDFSEPYKNSLFRKIIPAHLYMVMALLCARAKTLRFKVLRVLKKS